MDEGAGFGWETAERLMKQSRQERGDGGSSVVKRNERVQTFEGSGSPHL